MTDEDTLAADEEGSVVNARVVREPNDVSAMAVVDEAGAGGCFFFTLEVAARGGVFFLMADGCNGPVLLVLLSLGGVYASVGENVEPTSSLSTHLSLSE